nr:MAG TPA: hypothetical protein [Caudoviricetes sp.]
MILIVWRRLWTGWWKSWISRRCLHRSWNMAVIRR